MKLDNFKIIIIYLIFICPYFIIFYDRKLFIAINREDALIENLGAIFFMIASCLFFAAYIYSSGLGNNIWRLHTKRNLFYFFLSILFLFCFGEEISWGQRIFNWQTPEVWREMSNQRETNIHNLWMLLPDNPDGTSKSVIYKILNYKTVFWAFCYLFFFIIPLLAKFSDGIRVFFNRIGWPLISLWIGSLFVADYIVYHIILKFIEGSPPVVYGKFVELRESNFAFIFSIMAFHELKKVRGNFYIWGNT
jgi:hypothetical protein